MKKKLLFTILAVALLTVMLALGVIMPMIAVAGKISERGVLAGVLGIAAVMAAILIFLVPALNDMKDLSNATDSAIAIGILMLALGITMPLIAAAGAISHGALVGAVAVAVAIVKTQHHVIAVAIPVGNQQAHQICAEIGDGCFQLTAADGIYMCLLAGRQHAKRFHHDPFSFIFRILTFGIIL